MWTMSYTGSAQLMMNVDWCMEFAHGSDMMYPIAELAQRALRSGEIITNTTWSFRSMVTHDIKIRVFDEQNKALQPDEDVVWSGLFTTNQGRKLAYRIIEDTAHPIIKYCRNQTINRWTLVWQPRYSYRDDSYTATIHEPYIVYLHEFLGNNPGFQISSLYELVTLVGAGIFSDYSESCWIDRDYLVVMQIQDIPTISQLDSRSLKNPTIQWRIGKIKTIWEWTYITIGIHFSFTEKPSKIIWAYKE